MRAVLLICVLAALVVQDIRADAISPLAVCGNGQLEEGEDADPPISPSSTVPVNPRTCRYDFSQITQLSCNGSCGVPWGGGAGCQQIDADALCKLRTGDPTSTARDGTVRVTSALRQAGICCPVADPSDVLGCVELGTLSDRGLTAPIVVHDTNLSSTHGTGSVVQLFDETGCTTTLSPNPICVSTTAELLEALDVIDRELMRHEVRLVEGTYQLPGGSTNISNARSLGTSLSGGWNGDCEVQSQGAQHTVIRGDGTSSGLLAVDLPAGESLSISDLTLEDFSAGIALAAGPESTVELKRVVLRGTFVADGITVWNRGNVAVDHTVVDISAEGCALALGGTRDGQIDVTNSTVLNQHVDGFASPQTVNLQRSPIRSRHGAAT